MSADARVAGTSPATTHRPATTLTDRTQCTDLDRPVDVALDRLAELVACSTCWLDREALERFDRLCGGVAATVEVLAGTKTCWADLYTAVHYVLDEPDTAYAGDRPELLAALADIPDLAVLNSFVDPEPLSEDLAGHVVRIREALACREHSGRAYEVAVDLDLGRRPRRDTWAALRAGVDGLFGRVAV